MARQGTSGPYALVAVALLLLAALSARSEAVDATRVKAAFLYNFAKFVQWPEQSLPEGAPLELCVIGDATTHERIRSTVEGKQARGHPVRARKVGGAQATGGCHMVYATAASGVSPAALAAAVAGRSVLTVGETEGFTQRGGVIRLLEEGGRLRFAVNPTVAERAGLGISSRLLKLARVVRD